MIDLKYMFTACASCLNAKALEIHICVDGNSGQVPFPFQNSCHTLNNNHG